MILTFLIAEVLIAFGYAILAQLVYKRLGFDFSSILKGMIERGFLVICLMNGYPHGLTLFGALKLATRLKRNDEQDKGAKAFNDYYLLGNAISVSVAIGYVKLLENDVLCFFTDFGQWEPEVFFLSCLPRTDLRPLGFVRL